jgi:hypothetical protein
MQKWAGMAVHAISYHSGPLPMASPAQFRGRSAPTKARGLSVPRAAVHAWDGTPRLCTAER